MADRLSPLDSSFLYLEDRSTAAHVGSVMVLEQPPEGFGLEDLARHVAARIAYIPRYRQRVRSVPGRLAGPVWVDDERFELDYHVRRTALPRPGTEQQLRELVARVQGRRLDRSRPLWEVYLVEGLADGGLAIITKTHQAMVDGVAAVDLGQVLWSDEPSGAEPPAGAWRPSPEPSPVELVTGAVVDAVRRPSQVLDLARAGIGDARAVLERVAGAAGDLVQAASSAARPSHGPLEGPVGDQRRFAVADTDLEDYRAVRAAYAQGSRARRRSRLTAVGGTSAHHAPGTGAAPPRLDVNDVVLATVAGALRCWLLARGDVVGPGTVVRTTVPLSVAAHAEADDPDALGPGGASDLGSGALTTRVTPHLVDLPVGEPSPVVRLQQIAFAMSRHDAPRIGARELAGLGGFAPPTLHSLGVRVASTLSRRLVGLVVTNVPGPQHPLYVGPVRLQASYPVIPLAAGQPLAVGVTSYDGAVSFGLHADRDVVPDLDLLPSCLTDALAELVDAVS